MRHVRSILAAVTLGGTALALLHCGGDDTGAGADGGVDATTDTGADGGCVGCGVDAGGDGAVDGGGDTGGPAADASDGATDAGADAADAADAACDPEACTSGVCQADGGCAPPCSTTNPCDGGLTCCSGRCSDLKDSRNCGACGVGCGATQFCNATACAEAVVQNVCGNPAATVVLDALQVDDDAGVVLAAALATCAPAVTVTLVGQDDGGVIDPASGKPLLRGGDTFVAPGGGFGQKAVAYFNANALAPVFVTGTATSLAFVQRADAGVIVDTPNSALTAGHDFFVVMTAPDPQTGMLLFAVYGLQGPGTTAGAWYVQNVVLPSVRAQAAGDAGDAAADGGDAGPFPNAWYVYEWTDGNANALPDSADTFTLRGSGR